MLDAFGNLREQNDNLKSDKENHCYICNVTRDDLEKKKLKFKDHITEKHFLWNYVFYIISLNSKSKQDFTGLEYEIYKQFDQTDEDMKINWIPNGEEGDYSAEDDLNTMIKMADEFNEGVLKSIPEFESNVKDFAEKAA